MTPEGGRGAGAASVDPALQEHIVQALQPVLDDFQQHLSSRVREQLEQSVRQGEAHGARDQSQAEATLPIKEEPARHEQQSARPAGSTDTSEQQTETHAEGLDALGPALSEALQGLGERAGQWLARLLESGLDALFSESVRATILEQAEEGLHALLEETFDALPDDRAVEEARTQTEEASRDILTHTLDSLFAGSIRAELERHGDRAIQELVEGNFDTARYDAEQAIVGLLQGILRVLQDHWTRVFHVLFKVVVAALEDALASTVKEKLHDFTLEPEKEVDDKVRPKQQELQEKADDLREQFAEATDSLRERVEEETQELQERLKQGLKSGAKEGMSNTQLGRPPSRPTWHPPPGRVPSRRAPSGRPPSRGPGSR